MRSHPSFVIAGLDPAIPLSDAQCPLNRDGRVNPGHDQEMACAEWNRSRRYTARARNVMRAGLWPTLTGARCTEKPAAVSMRVISSSA
jgi:hypothetical protein